MRLKYLLKNIRRLKHGNRKYCLLLCDLVFLNLFVGHFFEFFHLSINYYELLSFLFDNAILYL